MLELLLEPREMRIADAYLVVGEDQSICYHNILSSSCIEDYHFRNIIRGERFAAAIEEISSVGSSTSIYLRINCVCLRLVTVKSHHRKLLQP